MSKYVKKLIKSGKRYFFNDHKTIMTDRMGPYSEQLVVLTWVGRDNHSSIELTPDEVECLFEKKLAVNLYQDEMGKLCMNFNLMTPNSYSGAIVCGVLAPSTQNSLRKEILAYAKKMHYISKKMKPVTMFSGTKSLIFNNDGTYSIFFQWNDDICKLDQKILYDFTKDFFSNRSIELKNDGVLVKNLTEEQTFSDHCINRFRVYDLQLIFLNPQFNKRLLLKSILKNEFVGNIPFDVFYGTSFQNTGRFENSETTINFNKFGKCKMNCGIMYYDSEYDSYTYHITVPYSEQIRELMLQTERILSKKYYNITNISFSGFRESIYTLQKKDLNKKLNSKNLEDEIIALDYAILLLQYQHKCNYSVLYRSIVSLLEMYSSKSLRSEYYLYRNELEDLLKKND